VTDGLPSPTTARREAIAAAAKELDSLRTTWLNPPAWLANAHRRLDEAVFAAYGWPADLSDDDLLARLLALNLERAGTR
jgi:hypothetical protein